MANKQFIPPISGVSYGFQVGESPQPTSGYMNNVFPKDTMERQVRLGQRPGMKKVYTQQITSATTPVMALIQVTTID